MKELSKTYLVDKDEFRAVVGLIRREGFTFDSNPPNLVTDRNDIFDGDAPVGNFNYQVLHSPKEHIEDFSQDVITGIALHVYCNTRLYPEIEHYVCRQKATPFFKFVDSLIKRRL